MKLKQCANFGGQKNLKCASWNKYNQEEMKKKLFDIWIDLKTAETIFPFFS